MNDPSVEISEETIQDLIERYQGIIPEVAVRLQKMAIATDHPIPKISPELVGLVVLDSDTQYPKLPEDITGLTDLDIGRLFSLFTAYANYLNTLCTTTQAQLAIYNRSLSVVESALKVYYRKANVPASSVGDFVAIDNNYITLEGECLSQKILHMQLESQYEQHKRALHLISREQTRRSDELKFTINGETKKQGSETGNPTNGRPLGGWKRRP